MNILILGTGVVEQKLINLCLKSHFLDHIYTASNNALENIPNIEYADYEDLSNKAKAIQADIILVADKNLIQDGVVDFLRKRLLNVISVNKKWFNLESSRIIAKRLMNYYSINHSGTILAPIAFPVVLKTDKPEFAKIIYSMSELVDAKEKFVGKEIFLEEYLSGEVAYLLSLWDGKSLIHFCSEVNPTEVQQDRLELYKTKLSFMFSDEKPDFIGFFTTKLIWAKNDWHVLEYVMHIDGNAPLDSIDKDFLYILNSVIYQKLAEISS